MAALKAKDPARFFGPCLETYGLTFADAALIDDRTDNCQAFAGQGGTPVPFKMDSDDLGEALGPLVIWLEG